MVHNPTPRPETGRNLTTIIDAIAALADAEINADRTIQAIRNTLDDLTPHLDYNQRTLWWDHLKRCKINLRADEGQVSDEDAADRFEWFDRAEEALYKLADG